tara:strand:- start:2195 stop:2716 length:522 start_codon:yes stop_codon:yes gene_type:complete
MYREKLPALSILIVALILFTGCSSSSDELDSGSEDGGILTSRITNEGSIHVIADFEAAGLKKPKSLKADAVDKKTGEAITPEATEVHLGFFKSSMGPKDVEVRFYKSHSDAITYGVPPAEKTIITVVAFTNALTRESPVDSTSKYGAYLVTGNAIMICQSQIEVCDELAEGLD